MAQDLGFAAGPPVVQGDWDSLIPPVAENAGPGSRTSERKLPRALRRRSNRLRRRADYPEIAAALATYLRTVVPNARATEHRGWSLTSMPSTKVGIGYHRLACVSCGPVETLVIGEAGPFGSGETSGFLNLAHRTGAELDELRRLGRRPDVRLEFGHYRATGDVTTLVFDSPAALVELLTEPVVVAAARELAAALLPLQAAQSLEHDGRLAADVLPELVSATVIALRAGRSA